MDTPGPIRFPRFCFSPLTSVNDSPRILSAVISMGEPLVSTVALPDEQSHDPLLEAHLTCFLLFEDLNMLRPAIRVCTTGIRALAVTLPVWIPA